MVQFRRNRKGQASKTEERNVCERKRSLNMNVMTSLRHETKKTERNAGDHVFIEIWNKCKWSKGTIYYQWGG